MNEYDISRAFKRIENDLMDSMMRNLKRHQAEETELGFNWEQWQALQLKELERYRKENAQLFTGDFKQINSKVDAMFKATCKDAQAKQENYILEQIKKGDFTPTQLKDTQFFNLNDDKLNILIERTKADFTRAEYAMLRKADDVYRQTIFDAQVYASVTNDYAKAVDMATKDFLMKGIQCVTYSNGAKHTISDYAEMCVRTGNKRAYLMGEGNAHDKYGIHTVRVNKRTQACPKCVGFLGRVLVDDVYGGGTRTEALKLQVPTLSDAIQAGFLHPNCKDIYSLYIDGVSRPATPWTKQEIEQIVGDYNTEQDLQHAQDMAESYRRMAKYALSPENQARYQARADNWEERVKALNATPIAPVVQSVWDRNNIKYSKTGQSLKDNFERYGVEYNQVDVWDKQPSEEAIISMIAGGDETDGSCVSVACAYIGNKTGLRVRDFRGGGSCDVMQFSSRDLAGLDKVVSLKEEGDLIKPAKKLLAQVEESKEYLLVTGRHASIVRKKGGVLQYLELQSNDNYGWKDFERKNTLNKGKENEREVIVMTTSETLKKRFGCYGKSSGYSRLMEVESFRGSDEFRDLLGYINTAENKQKKGASGHVK